MGDSPAIQFNEQQRLLNEAELIASKRRIQELEADAEQPKSKKPRTNTCQASLIGPWPRLGLQVHGRRQLKLALYVPSTAAIGVSQPAKHEGLTVGHTKLRV